MGHKMTVNSHVDRLWRRLLRVVIWWYGLSSVMLLTVFCRLTCTFILFQVNVPGSYTGAICPWIVPARLCWVCRRGIQGQSRSVTWWVSCDLDRHYENSLQQVWG